MSNLEAQCIAFDTENQVIRSDTMLLRALKSKLGIDNFRLAGLLGLNYSTYNCTCATMSQLLHGRRRLPARAREYAEHLATKVGVEFLSRPC